MIKKSGTMGKPGIISIISVFIAIVSIASVFLLREFHASAQQANRQERKEETLRQIKQAPFLRETNLHDGRMLLHLRDKLGLTAGQVEKIENLVMEQETVCIRSSAEIKIKELRFASYLKSGTGESHRKEIARYIREISKEKTDMIVHYMNYLLDLKELLTPRQLEILEQEKKEKEQREPGVK